LRLFFSQKRSDLALQGSKRGSLKNNKIPGFRLPELYQRGLDKRVCERSGHARLAELSKLVPSQQSAAQADSADHFRGLYTSFSLFMVLYLPDPASENDPVGEDLMEWLNVHFIEPSTEEGDHLSALDRPWEDDVFWPYLTR
jgi:hypothetical protein